LAIGSTLAIALTTYAIIGIKPLLSIDSFGVELDNKVIFALASVSVGYALTVLAIANPPLSVSWFAYMNVAGVLMVVNGILHMDGLLKGTTKVHTMMDTTPSPAPASRNGLQKQAA
jgi:hypothetical protein